MRAHCATHRCAADRGSTRGAHLGARNKSSACCAFEQLAPRSQPASTGAVLRSAVKGSLLRDCSVAERCRHRHLRVHGASHTVPLPLRWSVTNLSLGVQCWESVSDRRGAHSCPCARPGREVWGLRPARLEPDGRSLRYLLHTKLEPFLLHRWSLTRGRLRGLVYFLTGWLPGLPSIEAVNCGRERRGGRVLLHAQSPTVFRKPP